jgi:hypothetical protein
MRLTFLKVSLFLQSQARGGLPPKAGRVPLWRFKFHALVGYFRIFAPSGFESIGMRKSEP